MRHCVGGRDKGVCALCGIDTELFNARARDIDIRRWSREHDSIEANKDMEVLVKEMRDAGGESGSNARPSHPDWFRRMRDDCVAAGVPFLFKQWGAYFPQEDKKRSEGLGHYCDHSRCWRGPGEGIAYARIGKKAAGRMLDGRTWDEFPKEFK